MKNFKTLFREFLKPFDILALKEGRIETYEYDVVAFGEHGRFDVQAFDDYLANKLPPYDHPKRRLREL